MGKFKNRYLVVLFALLLAVLVMGCDESTGTSGKTLNDGGPNVYYWPMGNKMGQPVLTPNGLGIGMGNGMVIVP